MRSNIIIRFFFITLFSMSVLIAAQHIVPTDDGYFYTDSMNSKIYYTDGSTVKTIISAPGVGYFFTLSSDQTLLGFKYRENAGGKEVPAILDINSQNLILLHDPVYCAGQVSFSKNGKIAYTIDNILYVKYQDSISEYDLGSYANLTPISPDGNSLVFNDDHDQLWILNLQDDTRDRITEGQYGNVFPSWSADSRFIAYNSLDGSLKVYDREERSTLDIAMGSNLVWSKNSDEFSYTEFHLNDNGELANTDIVVSNMQHDILFTTNTDNLNESNSFYCTDGKVAYLTYDGKMSSTENNSFYKKSLNNISFSTMPVSFTQEVAIAGTYLDVPYVNQVYDTPGPRGYSSCAPTTAAMVMAYYGIFPKWPFVSGFGNTNNYGAYVHERYYYNDTYFDLSYRDCNTAQTTCYTCYGGMGYMWTGGSPNSRMKNYYGLHGVSGSQKWNVSWSTVAAELDKEQPYSICNYLSGSGHLVVGLGRTDNGQRTVYANDPYGNRNMSSWPNYYGKTVQYDWPGYNHGHASLNYANSGSTSMPWCIATTYTSPTLVDSIVDDKQFNDGFYIKASGNTVPMRYYRSTKSGYGGHHWWTYSEASESDICYVTWTPRIEDNYYEVKAYIPASATATAAFYKIDHAAGKDKIVVDQSSHPDSWVSLGKYMMKNDGSDYIYLGDSTGVSSEKIAFDAMKWIPASVEGLDISADHTTGYPNYNIKFSVVSTLAEGEYEYSWDFGDGLTARGDSVKHNYVAEGSYDVTVSATAGGIIVSDTLKNYIEIIENVAGELKLLSPDSLEIVHNLRPVLSWQAIPGALDYIVYINDIPQFSDSVSTINNWLELDEDLAENKTMYWQVRARHAEGDKLSRVWGFHVNTVNSLPLAFNLLSPIQNFIADTLKPSFSWEASFDKDPGDEILEYDLYLGTHTDSMLCIYNGPEITYQMIADLKENGTYLWYVEAKDQTSAITRSSEAYRDLAINTVNEPPTAPVQISPSHNSYQTTRYPHLEWTASQDPDPGDEIHYKMFYWYTGRTSVYNLTISETSYDNRRFNDQKEYFWTVAAIDNDNVYTFSDT
ncbi:MAG: PKD domain-containing protein, partial [Candidatus Marinimicrobia bacterium]|nr:PKD domain-containing protein [Candidatus Neomarinimicrobiota bacterium]